LNDDGNLIDASCLAAVGALLDARMPALIVEEEKYAIDHEAPKKERLPINGIPLNVTIAKIGNTLLVDPTAAEMEAMDTRLTVGMLDDKLCSLQKGGKEGILLPELEMMLDLAQHKATELRKMLLDALER
jgi:exosome complex component RRP42